jgi:hypothetical protein
MKKIITILAFLSANLGFSQSINGIKDTIMDDRLNFELLDKFARKTQYRDEKGVYFDYYWFFTENGTDTQLFGDTRNGFTVWQTPPAPAFFVILKSYYPNGYLKKKGKCMGGKSTMVGEWEYYDETEQLTSKKNEDEKFGKFGYKELLLFLDQQGHINLETGKNRENTDFAYNVENKQWGVRTMNNRYWITEYVMDGETGEIIDKKEYQGGME